MENSKSRLRSALKEPRMLVAPFVHDALQARIAEAEGFESVYLTGFGTAASRGLPDLGLLTMTEIVQSAGVIAASVDIPIICDADTGYGDALNVMRTVGEYERAGVAALHLEDQVWPKRCGFLDGKRVIPLEEMVPKLRAACDARRDPNLVIIARTDALQPEGWDSAERRARAYREAGADLVFVDGIRTLADLDEYAQRLEDLPRMYNGTLVPVEQVEQRGFRLMIHPGTLAVEFQAMRNAMARLRRQGDLPEARDPGTFAEMLQLLRVPEMIEQGNRYRPS